MKTVIFIAAASLALAQTNKAPAQKTFATPEAAAQDLIQAAASNNQQELDAIFGPQFKTVLTSGNPSQDKSEQQEFAKIAESKHSLQKDSMDPNRMILNIGNEDWPFPVPIVKRNGSWIFDTAMGQRSMKARRIGSNELAAVEICSGLVSAEIDYAQRNGDHNYASNVAALGTLVPADFAEAPKTYHGYKFAILKSQGPNAPGGAHNYVVKNALMGGFAIVAWPAQYGVSGVNTFIVNQDGVVYEKNLGPHAAAPVATYNPDTSWRPVN